MKNVEKRARVMRRSMRLGHCICDPKKVCPCDTLRDRDVCPCAGERPEPSPEPVRLTRLVDNPGCASKVDAATLRRVLAGLPFSNDPRVLVGAPAGDDAGVYLLDESTALVQTVDVFSPPVDDPYQFGRIAAANSLSDIWAMGARPLTALSIVGFPTRTAPEAALHEILRGGADAMNEAGVAVVGGHTIQDPEIKAGFAVTGVVHPGKIVTNAAARPGDRLILTKPLGTGIVAFAAQIGRAPPGAEEAAARSMAQLNRRAAELMLEFGAHACTDVTGFGLAGHLGAMAAASGVDVEIVLDDLPLLAGVLQCAIDDIFPGAVERNREASGHAVCADEDVPPALVELLFDPQTSGGLLIAAAENVAPELVARLRQEGMADAAVIGCVRGAGSGLVVARHEGRIQLPPCSVWKPLGVRSHQPEARARDRTPSAPSLALRASVGVSKQTLGSKENPSMSCCSENHGPQPTGGEPVAAGLETQKKFHDFLKTANAPAALDARTKQAVAIALSVLARCEPCVKIHVKKARDMGFSQAEIDEAAWMAIAFGGSPTMMFYNGVKEKG